MVACLYIALKGTGYWQLHLSMNGILLEQEISMRSKGYLKMTISDRANIQSPWESQRTLIIPVVNCINRYISIKTHHQAQATTLEEKTWLGQDYCSYGMLRHLNLDQTSSLSVLNKIRDLIQKSSSPGYSRGLHNQVTTYLEWWHPEGTIYTI